MTDWKAEAHRLKFTRHRSYNYISKRLGISYARVKYLLSDKYKTDGKRRYLRSCCQSDPEQIEQQLQLLRTLRFR
jgi:hypothetical protein